MFGLIIEFHHIVESFEPQFSYFAKLNCKKSLKKGSSFSAKGTISYMFSTPKKTTKNPNDLIYIAAVIRSVHFGNHVGVVEIVFIR